MVERQNDDGTWSEAEPCKASWEKSESDKMTEKDKNSNGLLSTYGFKSMGYYMAESVVCSVYIISIVFASIHFNCPKLLWALIGVLIL